jgi:hypothetical protein
MAKRGRPKGSKNGRALSTINLDIFHKIVERHQQLPKKCTRCNGPMIPGYEDATCLYCGEYACSDKVVPFGAQEFPPRGEERKRG